LSMTAKVLNHAYLSASWNALNDHANPGESNFSYFCRSQATGASLVMPGKALRNPRFVGKVGDQAGRAVSPSFSPQHVVANPAGVKPASAN
jgi:hypothetical protein